jgi:hypothetical protein
MALPTRMITPGEIRAGDRALHGSAMMWTAVEDAEVNDDNGVVTVRVQYADGGVSVRRWDMAQVPLGFKLMIHRA